MEIHAAQNPLCPPENHSVRKCAREGWISVWAAGDDGPRDQVELSRKSSQPRILALAAFLNYARANRWPGTTGSGYLVDNDYVLVENQGKGGALSQ